MDGYESIFLMISVKNRIRISQRLSTVTKTVSANEKRRQDSLTYVNLVWS